MRITRALIVLSIASALMFQGGPVTASSATFVGPSAYRSTADIPSGFFSGGYSLETFEDGTLDFGVIVTSTQGTILGPGGATDSVDGDDGAIDGSGKNGHSYVANGDTGVLFTFPNPLPTAAAMVWTDGGINTGTTFEAFGPGMVSLGTIGPTLIADGVYNGTTAEDRFFGVQSPGGILAIKLTHPFGQIEVDHLMFGNAASTSNSPSCTYPFSKGSGAAAITYCVSDRGTIVKLEAPLGQEHIASGNVWEGFVVCSGTTASAWDLSGSESGFGPASVVAGPTATSVTLRRSSAQFQLDQMFAFDSKEKDVTVTMTLINISNAAITDVRLARAYDPDVDGAGDDVEMRTLRSVWAGEANALSLTGTLWTFATDTAVDTGTTPTCSPVSAPTPATTGDATLASVTYRLGNMNARAKKKVTFVYRMQ